MSINFEGRKEARKTLDRFHACLNSPSLLPSQSYVPNRPVFLPVMLINQIVALVISKNYEPIPFLMSQSFRHFDKFEGKPVYENYKAVAFDYLCQVAYFLSNFTDLNSDYLRRNIPEEIFNVGENKAPRFNSLTHEFDTL